EGALSEAFLIEVLSSLVSTKSVNPGIYEQAIADRIAAWLEPTPAEVAIVEFAPGRPSVGAVLEGSGNGPRLVLNGHIDTVPIDDLESWTNDPFEPTVRDGYVYGRGSCDMKAGLTTQIAVAHHLAALGEPLKGSLVLHFAAGEECGEPGTLSLLEHGFTGDFGIVTEPTQVRVSVATRGLAHYRILIKGQSIHASRSHLGDNPVLRLRGVLEALEAYDADVRAKEHPLLPGGSCTPTVLHAGVKENAVADSCELFLDRRLLPGESVEGELGEIQARLNRISGLRAEVSVIGLPFAPAEIAHDSAFAAEVAKTVAETTGREDGVIGTPFASDVRNLVNDAGIEAITLGPGNVAECHCVDERVAIAELTDAARSIAAVARKLLL
ncbi:MAG: succinyl-diaminopimelate desuccinylase, partial [Solirubrobacteraceae bacterium]|nr:succinyl-diaminopimelate desuccinylase [Solirubrobacteraceae bacterium]